MNVVVSSESSVHLEEARGERCVLDVSLSLSPSLYLSCHCLYICLHMLYAVVELS